MRLVPLYCNLKIQDSCHISQIDGGDGLPPLCREVVQVLCLRKTSPTWSSRTEVQYKWSSLACILLYSPSSHHHSLRHFMEYLRSTLGSYKTPVEFWAAASMRVLASYSSILRFLSILYILFSKFLPLSSVILVAIRAERSVELNPFLRNFL